RLGAVVLHRPRADEVVGIEWRRILLGRRPVQSFQLADQLTIGVGQAVLFRNAGWRAGMLRERRCRTEGESENRGFYFAHVGLTVVSEVMLRRCPAASLMSRPFTRTLWPLCSSGCISSTPTRRICCEPSGLPSAAFTSSVFENPGVDFAGSVALESVQVLLGPSPRHPMLSTMGIALVPCGGPANSAPAPRPPRWAAGAADSAAAASTV